MRNNMTNPPLHHRFQLPNGLAIFAAVLLLISSVVGFEDDQVVNSSGHETASSAKIESAESDAVSNAANRKSRGLNLGLLLFRRG